MTTHTSVAHARLQAAHAESWDAVLGKDAWRQPAGQADKQTVLTNTGRTMTQAPADPLSIQANNQSCLFDRDCPLNK